VIEEGLLAEEVTCKGMPTLGVEDDVVCPERGSCFLVFALEGLHITFHNLGFAQSIHSLAPF